MNHKDQAHAAIDRLVTHLEREATEHVHALDALRAEVESLRTQNEHLRHLVEESRKIHDANAAEFPPEREVGTYRGVKVYADDSLPNGTVVAKPAREVVRGKWGRREAMLEPGYGTNADNPRCRHAVLHGDSVGGSWVAYSERSHGECTGLTESEAIAWCLDGVLPAK